jgi:hypothetical protein
VLRTDITVVVIALASGVLWIEHGHRVVIDAPAADTAVSVVAACSDTDAVPYSTACLEYIKLSSDTGPRLPVVASLAAPAPCPDTDRVPYSPSCIAFMKGATETGMRWRATAEPPSIPAPQ